MTKRVKKILLISGLVVVVLCGGGYAGYKGYRSVRQAKLLDQAREQIERGDDRKAVLFLQRALRYNYQDVEAARMMADLADRSRSPMALVWRSRVVDLEPDSFEDRLALARTAMIAKDLQVATNALAGVDEKGKASAAFNNLAGTVAATSGRLGEASKFFSEAARLEPNNPAPMLNLAVIRLQSTNQVDVAEAKDLLVGLSLNQTNRAIRTQALRELTMNALREGRPSEAVEHSRNLVAQTNSLFSDRLLRLQALQQNTANKEFQEALNATQREAATTPAHIIELVNWKMPRVGPGQTLDWLKSLPEETRTNNSVLLLQAECMAAQKDWKELQKHLDSHRWYELEFLRFAFRSLAMRGQGLTAASKGDWEVAIKASNYNKNALAMLVRLAGKWGWLNEAEEVLWAIVNRHPSEKWAVYTLMTALQESGQTRPLMELCKIEAKRSPNALVWKNNLIMLALLLEAQELKPYDMARELYQQAGTNSAFASTYAFALHTQGRTEEALKIMRSLPPKDLENPAISGYYGLMLQAAGETERARVYFDWALRSKLLPEERKLFTQRRAT